jgi:hypothetical protein
LRFAGRQAARKARSNDTFVTYLYRARDGTWKTLPGDGSTPADLTTVTLPDGRTVDFVVRREVGTINRFLYSFALHPFRRPAQHLRRRCCCCDWMA